MWGEGRQREARAAAARPRRQGGLDARGPRSRTRARTRPSSPDSSSAVREGVRARPRRVRGASRRVRHGAARFAVEREMKVAKDDASALDAALARGFPPGHVLVDRGRQGGRAAPAREEARRRRAARDDPGREGGRRGTPSASCSAPVLEALLAGTGKRVDHAAEARLADARRRRRARPRLRGREARGLRRRPQGHRREGRGRDRDARRRGPVLRARERRRGARPRRARSRVLGRSIEDGASPFMLLGSLAGTRAADDRRARARPEGRGRPAPIASFARVGGDGAARRSRRTRSARRSPTGSG